MSESKKVAEISGESKPKGTRKRTKKVQDAVILGKEEPVEEVLKSEGNCVVEDSFTNGGCDVEDSYTNAPQFKEGIDKSVDDEDVVEKFNEEMEEILSEEELKAADEARWEAMEQEVLAEDKLKDIQREKNRAATVHYDNGFNVWRLIAKTENEVLGWEHTTMAMATGKSGVLVSVKEGFGNQTKLALTYLSDSRLEFDTVSGKYFIR